MVIISSQPLFNGFLFGKWQSAARRHRHLERGNASVWVTRILGSNETQSREISCHHGLATFRSEISPLRFASVEMTRVSQPLFPYLAKSVALVSRITTTFTCPGYCSSFSMRREISWDRMVA